MSMTFKEWLELQEVSTSTGSVAGFARIALPMVRRQFMPHWGEGDPFFTSKKKKKEVLKESMKFKLWLEDGSLVQNIMDHISKSIEYMLDGQWSVESAKKLMKTWRHQSYQKVRMIGRNVGQPGDVFEVVVSIYVYKKPRSTFDAMNVHAVYNPPSWVNDPNQWDDAQHYDAKEGSPIVDLHVTIRGSKEGKSDKAGPLGPMYAYVGESDKDFGRKLKTPYEVAQYVKKKIDDFYSKWDNDNDGDNDNDAPEWNPAPSSSVPQLVGV